MFWFCWTWTYRPATRWLYSAYAESLAVRDSLKCRRVLQSPWYRGRYGQVFQLTGDQNAKIRFENDRTGYRIATSVGGVGTGEGGDFIVVDDPHKVNEAESDLVRKGTVDWWMETMSTRGNDPASVVKVIVMQRVHEGDLTGEVLARGLGYDHLCLPMQYEPTERITSIGFQDPRRRDGELLWPQRFTSADVEDLTKQLGLYGAAGQLQQRPAPRGGGMFQRPWFEIVAASPAEADRVRYWDKAGTAGGTGAQTAGVLMCRVGKGPFYVEDVITGRWSSSEREQVIKQTAELDARRGLVDTWVEQEPGSGGKESAENTILNLAGYTVHAERVTGDKAVRAEPFAAQASVGNVKLVQGDWNEGFLAQAETFPTGRLKDIMDAASGALNKLALKQPAGPGTGMVFGAARRKLGRA